MLVPDNPMPCRHRCLDSKCTPSRSLRLSRKVRGKRHPGTGTPSLLPCDFRSHLQKPSKHAFKKATANTGKTSSHTSNSARSNERMPSFFQTSRFHSPSNVTRPPRRSASCNAPISSSPSNSTETSCGEWGDSRWPRVASLRHCESFCPFLAAAAYAMRTTTSKNLSKRWPKISTPSWRDTKPHADSGIRSNSSSALHARHTWPPSWFRRVPHSSNGKPG